MSGAATTTYQDEARAAVPRWYRGGLHAAWTVSISLGAGVALAAQVRAPSWGELAVAPAFFLVCSLLEYLEHRYILHRRLPPLEFAFRIHALEHHRFYTDEHFQPRDPRDFAFVLFPPALIVAYVAVIVLPVTALVHRLASPNVGFLVGATACVYFLAYEAVHLASHVAGPGAPAPVRWLASHHRIHHDPRGMGECNFNIVLPVFDWLFGTLRTERRAA